MKQQGDGDGEGLCWREWKGDVRKNGLDLASRTCEAKCMHHACTGLDHVC